ncbi:MAG: protein kinase [Scytolyngbya sp. HA4215-MV1]|nr:protein kinase [Scytolyngbya sp. HA4215-MV1]
MSLTVGTVLQNGKYILDTALGQTRWSVTYRATATQTHQSVIIKTLSQFSRDRNEQAKLYQRFLEEARQLLRCQHPNLANALDCFEETGLPFLVMNDVLGQSFATRVQMKGALPEAEAIHAIRQVGAALQVLHQHGLVHGNISPQTLLRCDRTSFAVLTGFGIAQRATTTPPESNAIAAGYAAIEQYFPSKGITSVTDVYGLAATLYFLLTGKTPTSAPLRDRLPLTEPRQFQPSLSLSTEQAVLQGMAIEPKLRPRNIQAWLQLLPGTLTTPSVNGATRSHESIVTIPPQFAHAHAAPSVPVIVTHSPTLAVAPAVAQSHTPASVSAAQIAPRATKGWGSTLGLASMLAILAGVGVGLAIRISDANSPGAKLFNAEQSFPPSTQWPGTKAADNFQPAVNVPAPPPRTTRSSSQIVPPQPILSPVPRRQSSAPVPENSPAAEEPTAPEPLTSPASTNPAPSPSPAQTTQPAATQPTPAPTSTPPVDPLPAGQPSNTNRPIANPSNPPI